MFIINSHLLQYNNFSSSKHDKEFCWCTTCYGLNFKTEETSLSTFSRYDCCSRFYACYYFIHSFFCRRKWATAPDNYIFVSFYKHRWWFYIWLVVKSMFLILVSYPSSTTMFSNLKLQFFQLLWVSVKKTHRVRRIAINYIFKICFKRLWLDHYGSVWIQNMDLSF